MKAIDRPLSAVDPDVAAAIAREARRQEDNLELIPSENAASRAILEAQGSVLTNKYAEGYPGKRYYGGCEHVDVVEEIAIARAKQLFGAEYANVQPHSGSSANIAVYLSQLQPGDTILAMDLSHGGHLTHGSPVNVSGKFFKIVSYGVRREDELIDEEAVLRLAREHRPKMIVAGHSAYSRVLDFAMFRRAADSCGAKLLVDMAHFAGLVAAGVHPSPVPFAEFITSTTHKTLRGPRGGIILARESESKAIANEIERLLRVAVIRQHGLSVLDLIDQIATVMQGDPLLQEVFNSLKLLRVLIMQAVKIVIFLRSRNKFLQNDFPITRQSETFQERVIRNARIRTKSREKNPCQDNSQHFHAPDHSNKNRCIAHEFTQTRYTSPGDSASPT